MQVFFPNEVWSRIIDYTSIHRGIHRKRLDIVLDDQRNCWEAMFDLLFANSPIWSPDLPLQWKLDYLDEDCVALSRETLENTMFVPTEFAAGHLNDHEEWEDAWEGIAETDMWIFDPDEQRCYIPVSAGILMLPYYRHAKPMELWAKNPGSLYRVRWALDYLTV